MSLKKKLVALFACLALCASFVPALAIADLADDEALDARSDVQLATQDEGEGEGADGVELSTQATNGQLVFAKAQSVSENKVSYEGGYALTVDFGTAEGTWSGTNLTLPDKTQVSVTFTPPEGYDGNPSLVIDGTAIPFEGGQLTFTTDFSSKTGVTVELDAGSGPQATRFVKVTIDQASVPMLSVDKARFTVGYGDQYDQEFTTNGQVLEVPDNTREKMILGFAITNKYFIPTAIVNGKTYETTDTGTSTDPSVANLCVELTGADADVENFEINLSIGARASVDLSAQSVSAASATYMTVDEGTALMTDITSDVALSIADTSLDPAVPNAVATFDLGATVDGETVSTLESPLDVSMRLDTSVYTASNYVVVRNHEGTTTELATTYDPTTGNLGFTSGDYSDYSLVAKDAGTTDTKATSKSTLANTGDPLSAVGFMVIGLIALAAAAFTTRKLRNQA